MINAIVLPSSNATSVRRVYDTLTRDRSAVSTEKLFLKSYRLEKPDRVVMEARKRRGSSVMRSGRLQFRVPEFVVRRFPRLARRFVRREDGATAVEFALIAIPFLAVLFAVIETALVFFAGQVLETATGDSARLIMTGQVQKQGMDEDGFKNEVCSRLQAMFDCEKIKVDVRTVGGFGGADLSAPVNGDGELDTSNFEFQPGSMSDIVVVRVVYEWPVFVPGFGYDLSNLSNGNRLLMSTAAFRNEPYN